MTGNGAYKVAARKIRNYFRSNGLDCLVIPHYRDSKFNINTRNEQEAGVARRLAAELKLNIDKEYDSGMAYCLEVVMS